MILVTGAAGKTGRAVIAATAARGAAVRALVHRVDQGDAVRAAGAAEVQVGDQRDPHVLQLAVDGVAAVYHIAPNVHPDEILMGEALIAVLRDAGTGRVVYHSVIHPQLESMPHHWRKLRVEERIIESSLPWSILRPSAYLQNVLAYVDEAREHGRYRVPYDTTRPAWMVDLRDVAEVAALVLLDPGHLHAAYDLSGPDGLTAEDVGAVLGRHLGRPVSAERQDPDEWRRQAGTDLPDSARDSLHAMFRHYDRHGLAGNPRMLAALLGRGPTGLGEVLRRGRA